MGSGGGPESSSLGMETGNSCKQGSGLGWFASGKITLAHRVKAGLEESKLEAERPIRRGSE